MPRSGPVGTASQPPGTTPQQPNTVIQSAVWNTAMDDIYQIFNTPTPVAYGGTGASNALGSADAFSTKGADIPSSTTTDIWAATGEYVHITGTTTITGFGSASAAGNERTVVFDGSLTITHSETLIIPGAANKQTASGDIAVVRSEGGSTNRIVSYQSADVEVVDQVLVAGPTSGAWSNADVKVSYKKLGKWVQFSGYVNIIANGTGAGSIIVNLPYANAGVVSPASGVKAGVGNLQVFINSSSNQLTIGLVDGSYAGGSGVFLYFSGVYRTSS